MSKKKKVDKKPPNRKNVSQTVKNGTAIKTRDEYFLDNKGYKKPNYENAPDTLYRESIVVDSNRNGHLGIIKIQSGGKKTVVNKSGQKEKYNLYIKTKDDEGNPIKLGLKFQRAKEKYGVTEKQANKMKKQAMKNKSNKIALRELKGRKKGSH